MRLLLAVVIAAIVIVFIGRYLGPDDLAGCAEQPSIDGSCRSADVIIAVSGGDTAARTDEAIRLYQSGWAPRIIFSGAAKDTSGPSNAAVMRDMALAAGVPEGAITIDEFGQNTKQNAEKSATLLEGESVSSIILVTSAYHQRRASLEFSERFSDVDIRNRPVAKDRQWSQLWWLTPVGWYLVLSEITGIMLFYVGVGR